MNLIPLITCYFSSFTFSKFSEIVEGCSLLHELELFNLLGSRSLYQTIASKVSWKDPFFLKVAISRNLASFRSVYFWWKATCKTFSNLINHILIHNATAKFLCLNLGDKFSSTLPWLLK